MNNLRRLSGSSENGRKSWWPFVCFSLFSIVLFGYRALVESDSATRQTTALASIGECHERGRGRQNYCDYTFFVGDERYTAINKAAAGLEIGQPVTVYYDSGDPNISALEDFSQQSRHDLLFVFVFGLVLVGVVAFVLWDRAPYETDEQAP